MTNRIFLVIVFVLWSAKILAQPVLPQVGTMSQGGIIILSWINPNVNNVKAVVVQRSSDSVMNFVTLGKVEDISRANQFFTDATAIEGDNYYRVKVVYDGGFEWVSNTVDIFVDSNDVNHRRVLPSNDSLQKIVTIMSQHGTPNISEIANMGFTPSRYVFANPYSGHINIELQNTLNTKYIIEFYSGEKKVLEIPRVNEDVIILDKRNFQVKGLYRFKIIKDGKDFESGMVSVY